MTTRITRAMFAAGVLAALAATPLRVAAQETGLQSTDIYRLRTVGDVQISPDGKTAVYAVSNNDRPGRPYSQVWLLDVANGTSRRLGGDGDTASEPTFSPDGRRLAFVGRIAAGSGLIVANADGSGPQIIAPVEGTNHPLPSSGVRLAWSPDGTRLAFISATPGPEADANGDPMVITRYLYKPTASEGGTRANDNRRLHIFIADVASRQVTQLTDGDYYEHSIDWSPKGDEILFISNRGPDPDRFFNYDIFAINVVSRNARRLSDTKGAEYYPRWSPDGRMVAFSGTTRPLTSSETTMEDTHVWVMNADGSGRREVGTVDNRQGAPEWSHDGRHLYVTLQERGEVRLIRLPQEGGAPERLVTDRGSVGQWALSHDGTLIYAFTTPSRPAELYVRPAAGQARAVTTLNQQALSGRTIADVEAVTFASFDGLEVQAYLTKPIDLAAGQKAPLVAMIHGGPHGQQGPAFNQKAQIYAANGIASLMVNYRGSTGYGQKHADAIFQDQNGGEAKDVLAGVDAALAKFPWLDGNRLGVEGGSYGGQLTDWLITQTDRFKAAIPSAGISNLVSFNYMAYYHDYLAVEFGGFPHERFEPVDATIWPRATQPRTIMDALWERSPIRYVSKVKTPTMFLHGENDNDVPIAEAEQFYIAIRDVGTDAVLVRYPREGHGIRETKHIEDTITRSLAWYRKHFGNGATSRD
ncbi:MAG TPA: S9 family peptidase [Vicinamibacterales bacterium]|nr:S9 family peptidase [Vicinamibacterales bacterium]